MKKNYTLTLEFEAELDERVSTELKKKYKNFKELLDVLLKNEQAVTDIYRNLVISDLCYDSHIFKVAVNMMVIKIKDEFGILKKVINGLPGVEKDSFLKILEGKNDKADEFFEDIFIHFGDLKVIDVKFVKKVGAN